MRIRLLGTAAGGGFPQWNCNCRSCAGVRGGRIRARPRSQSSVAISADGLRWFVLNVSPDIGRQIADFPPLGPPKFDVRGSSIDSVLLTNADLDHTLGLFQLREGGKLTVYANEATAAALNEGPRIGPMLEQYCGIEWRSPPSELHPLQYANESPSGLSIVAISLPGDPPLYARNSSSASPRTGEGWGEVCSDSVAYRIVDTSTGGSLVFAPDIAAWTTGLNDAVVSSDIALIDGTFWSDDEMQRAGVSNFGRTALQMGHLPIGGPAGSLGIVTKAQISKLVYIHINNTNPILIDDSPERAQVEAAGVIVGEDGMEFEV